MLVVVAVEAEAAAIRSAVPKSSDVRVLVGGVGPAAAAAATSVALAAEAPGLVLSAGIGGGFSPLAPGSVAVASCIAFADLGAETADGFAHVSALGLGPAGYDVEPQLAVELTDRTAGRLGSILTVATVTGTAAGAAELLRRYPDAVAEAMEGAGVAAAAAVHGVRCAEVRAVSNIVGPRDRDAWRIPDSLAALGGAVAAIVAGGPL